MAMNYEFEHHQQRMRDFLSNHVKQVEGFRNQLFEDEARAFIEHEHGADFDPNEVRGMYEQCYHGEDMALCSKTRTCILNDFPYMRWQEELTPYIWFKGWNKIEGEIMVVRLWETN